MRKHVLSKCLLSGAAMVAALVFQSCGSKQETNGDCPPSMKKAEAPCDDADAEKNDCDKWKNKKDCNKGCKGEETNSEVMIHVIEIDQPDSPAVSEEKAPLVPKVEVPAEAQVEASTTPASEPAQTPAAETASTAPVQESAETAVSEAQPAEAVSSPVVADSAAVSQ
jgi:hypothetical protein